MAAAITVNRIEQLKEKLNDASEGLAASRRLGELEAQEKAQIQALTDGNGVRPEKGKNMAIYEWPVRNPDSGGTQVLGNQLNEVMDGIANDFWQ